MIKEDAIKGLKENLCSLCVYGSQNMDSCDIRECDNRDYIKALEQQSTQSWIPVSEILPEEGKEVLAYYEYFRFGDYNEMWPTYGVGYQYDGRWYGDITGHKLNIIAWMPFPDYEEDER